jgi:TRAP-type C4-dicarboxylate transport system permease small subunit
MSNGQTYSDPRWLTFTVLTVPRIIIGAAILASIAINFANIVGRYVFLSPIIWAEEIMIYINVWCVFIGCILVTWDGRHLKMDLFSVMLKSPWKQVVNTIAVVGFILVCIFVVLQSWTVSGMMARLEQRSVVAEIPMVVPHSAVLLGFGAMVVVLLFRVRSYIMGAFGSDIEATAKQVEETLKDVGPGGV